MPPGSGCTRPAKVLGCFPARCGPPADHTAPPHALQEAARHHGSPDAALTSPAPAPPLPPADSESLPLAAGSLAFAVPPSLDAALEVLAVHHPASPKVAHGDAVTETAAACAAGLRRWGPAARIREACVPAMSVPCRPMHEPQSPCTPLQPHPSHASSSRAQLPPAHGTRAAAAGAAPPEPRAGRPPADFGGAGARPPGAPSSCCPATDRSTRQWRRCGQAAAIAAAAGAGAAVCAGARVPFWRCGGRHPAGAAAPQPPGAALSAGSRQGDAQPCWACRCSGSRACSAGIPRRQRLHAERYQPACGGGGGRGKQCQLQRRRQRCGPAAPTRPGPQLCSHRRQRHQPGCLHPSARRHFGGHLRRR